MVRPAGRRREGEAASASSPRPGAGLAVPAISRISLARRRGGPRSGSRSRRSRRRPSRLRSGRVHRGPGRTRSGRPCVPAIPQRRVSSLVFALRPSADDDHQVDLARRLERVLLAPDRHRADGVDDLQLVAPRDHERGELLELPRRLGRLADQRHLLACAGSAPSPLPRRRRSRSGAKPSRPTTSGCFGVPRSTIV